MSQTVILSHTAIPNSAHRNVSLKVVVAEKSGEFDNELRILKHLNESGDSNHPGKKHVVHLLDFFYLDGPNGRHLCLIFDVLGPQVSSVAERCPDDRSTAGWDVTFQRRFYSQLITSIHPGLFMVVSGSPFSKVIALADRLGKDIYTGNILLRVPGLDILSPENIITKFGQPVIGKVARRDGKPSEEGIPNYLVRPIEFSAQSTFGFCEVQLIDFGECKQSSLCQKSFASNIPSSFLC